MSSDLEPLFVYGAGEHVKVVLATLEAEGRYAIVGLLDDDPHKHGATVYGYPVLGGREQLAGLRGRGVSRTIVAVGDNQRRMDLVCDLKEEGFQLASAIHPTATCLRGACIGAGTVVLANAFVGADAAIGEGVIVSVGVVVGHDSVVDDFAQLTPGVHLGGCARVGDCAMLGMGATVLPRIKVGRCVVVGAHAVVAGDLPDGVTAAGVPAHIIDRCSP